MKKKKTHFKKFIFQKKFQNFIFSKEKNFELRLDLILYERGM